MAVSHYIVAQHAFSVALPDGDLGINLSSYEPFASNGEGEKLFVLTVDDAFYPSKKGELIGDFDCGSADFGVYRLDDGTYQMLICLPKGECCAILQVNPDFSEGVIATRGNNINRSFAVNNALMLMYAFASAQKDTLLVHASVIKYGDRGYLFLGKSGTGKSTHSSLWIKYVDGSELLNDDNPVVRIIDGEAWVYGSPWSGKTPCYKNDGAQIGAFVQIKQYAENYINREQFLHAFAILLPSMSTMKWDKRVYGGVCDAVGRLVNCVRVYTLGCRPDKEAAQVCSNEVTKQ